MSPAFPPGGVYLCFILVTIVDMPSGFGGRRRSIRRIDARIPREPDAFAGVSDPPIRPSEEVVTNFQATNRSTTPDKRSTAFTGSGPAA
jgi:hypothetical protein